MNTLTHSNSRWFRPGTAVLAATVLTLGACATTPVPTEQLAVTTAAVAHAVSAGGQELAPTEMGAARDKLVRAHLAVAAKDNSQALRLAQQAPKVSTVAASTAVPGLNQREWVRVFICRAFRGGWPTVRRQAKWISLPRMWNSLTVATPRATVRSLPHTWRQWGTVLQPAGVHTDEGSGARFLKSWSWAAKAPVPPQSPVPPDPATDSTGALTTLFFPPTNGVTP